jgi:hypothetical protein
MDTPDLRLTLISFASVTEANDIMFCGGWAIAFQIH